MNVYIHLSLPTKQNIKHYLLIKLNCCFEEGSLRSCESFAACIYSLAKLVFSNIKVIEPPNGLYVVNVLIGCLINIYIIENI